MSSLRITSLSEWEVDVSDEIHQDLQETTSNLPEVLQRMKRAPAVTTCRLSHWADRDAVIESIRDSLHPWLLGQSISVERLVITSNYCGLPDVVALQVLNDPNKTAELLQDCRHPPSSDHSATPSSEGWPKEYKVIIVDRFTGEAVLRGSHVYVRGVQCTSRTVHIGDPVAVYASMTPILRGLQLTEYTEGNCIFCGVGVAMADRGGIFGKDHGEAVRMQQTAGPTLPPMNALVGNGKGYLLQNLPSCVVARELAATMKEGDVIIDMCAAPGGKASHVASLMPANCHLVAVDKSARKVEAMAELFRNLQCYDRITSLVVNSTRIVDESETRPVTEIVQSSLLAENGFLSIKAFAPESFHHVLLDPPCSALGLRPKLAISQRRQGEMDWNTCTQKKLVHAAHRLLQPGGYMTYSTCTLRIPENEGMVRYILDNFHDMELVPLATPLGSPGGFGVLSEEEASRVRFFDPTDPKYDTMGFFLAKFRRAIVSY